MPYLSLPPELSDQIDEINKYNQLSKIEDNPYIFSSGFESEIWQNFSKQLYNLWQQNHWCVVRNIPNHSPVGAILTALALKHKFKTYRQGKIVKHFKMSPWTSNLSHTLEKGHFHTDINTSKLPPLITFIQCHKPDPTKGAGESRVVVLSDLLAELAREGQNETLGFLTDEPVRMVDNAKVGCWVGKIVENDTIQFHPETLRYAAKRFNFDMDLLEMHLSVIHQACLKVSHVIHLQAGDALVVSNHKALHYRGECTVRFEKFPTKFSSREIFVLHLLATRVT